MEQKRDKEKILLGLANQRKVLSNLVYTRTKLIEDNNKIYDDFN